MKIVLAGINAKYIQTNLAIRLLYVYAQHYSVGLKNKAVQLSFLEWNINQHVSTVVRALYESEATVVLFSVYIWNKEFVSSVISILKQIQPEIIIAVGGPEVSYNSEKFMKENLGVDLVLRGEGEQTFCEMLDVLSTTKTGSLKNACQKIEGITFRSIDGVFSMPSRPPIENLDSIPFPYTKELLDFKSENRIVYYESSRGCPFSCAYCLSSIEKNMRYYSLSRVLTEIRYFIDQEFPLIKFVDRTFNLDPNRYLEIWRCIRDNSKGKSLFHFEISAEYLDDAAFEILDSMPVGSIQFEIGIQSINEKTLKSVGRPAHPDILEKKIRRIPAHIHTHVDLIAGLPEEDLSSFMASFNFSFALGADMLQVGFLKILSGTKMEQLANESKGYVWTEHPPYEVLCSPELSYRDMLVIKDVEHVLDAWYNTSLFRTSIDYLVTTLAYEKNAFEVFVLFCEHIRSFYDDGDLYLPRRPSSAFECLASFPVKNGKECFLEYLKYDYFMQGKSGVTPVWMNRCYSKEAHEDALHKTLLAPDATTQHTSKRILYGRTEYEEFNFSGKADTREKIIFIYPESRDAKKSVIPVKL